MPPDRVRGKEFNAETHASVLAELFEIEIAIAGCMTAGLAIAPPDPATRILAT